MSLTEHGLSSPGILALLSVWTQAKFESWFASAGLAPHIWEAQTLCWHWAFDSTLLYSRQLHWRWELLYNQHSGRPEMTPVNIHCHHKPLPQSAYCASASAIASTPHLGETSRSCFCILSFWCHGHCTSPPLAAVFSGPACSECCQERQSQWQGRKFPEIMLRQVLLQHGLASILRIGCQALAHRMGLGLFWALLSSGVVFLLAV